jgi:hypothetical protein
MAEEAGATAKVGTFEEWLQFREDLATGDREIDKFDRRMYAAFRQIFFPDAAPNSSVNDNINDGELLRSLEPLEALAAESRFREAAKEIGLSRSMKQLRLLFGSPAVKNGVARKGAAPRSPMATLEIWIVVETAKRVKNLDTHNACKLLQRLGGLSVSKDTISTSSTRRQTNANSIRRRYYEEMKRNSGNIYFRMFAELCISQRLQEWRASGIRYEVWERKRLAEMARGAPFVSGNYPIFLPT